MQVANPIPILEINEVAYFLTNYVPYNYPFKVQRVESGWCVTIPNLGESDEYDNNYHLYMNEEDCLIYNDFYEDWDMLIGVTEYYIKGMSRTVPLFD